MKLDFCFRPNMAAYLCVPVTYDPPGKILPRRVNRERSKNVVASINVSPGLADMKPHFSSTLQEPRIVMFVP